MGYDTQEIRVVLRLSRHNDERDDRDDREAQELAARIKQMAEPLDIVLWVDGPS